MGSMSLRMDRRGRKWGGGRQCGEGSVGGGSLLLLRSPAISLRFTFLGEISAYITIFFNPTIEVVTFCLHGWERELFAYREVSPVLSVLYLTSQKSLWLTDKALLFIVKTPNWVPDLYFVFSVLLFYNFFWKWKNTTNQSSYIAEWNEVLCYYNLVVVFHLCQRPVIWNPSKNTCFNNFDYDWYLIKHFVLDFKAGFLNSLAWIWYLLEFKLHKVLVRYYKIFNQNMYTQAHIQTLSNMHMHICTCKPTNTCECKYMHFTH